MEQAIIRPKKLYEQVADHIAEAIRTKQYAPGDQLPSERELMERLGVGRSAVREALFALQRMGLVEVRSGTRARDGAYGCPAHQRVVGGGKALPRH